MDCKSYNRLDDDNNNSVFYTIFKNEYILHITDSIF